jgi:hypothetical protein
MNFKVCGIYDLNTVKNLISLWIKDFEFDIRPKSLNFIQIDNVAEIVNNLSLNGLTISLYFEDDKDFVIQHTIKTLADKLTITTSSDFKYDLFVGGLNNVSFFNQFGLNFCWKYNELVDVDSLKELEFLKGVSFEYDFLERLMNFGHLFDFMKEFKSKCPEGTYFQFENKWDSSPMETITDFLDFRSIQYEISTYVENSFRNIDYNKLNSFFIKYNK